MVVYAVAAEVSILTVFLAGILPGFLLMALFSGYIIVWAWLNPGKTPEDTGIRSVSGEAPRSCACSSPASLIVFVIVVMMLG